MFEADWPTVLIWVIHVVWQLLAENMVNTVIESWLVTTEIILYAVSKIINLSDVSLQFQKSVLVQISLLNVICEMWKTKKNIFLTILIIAVVLITIFLLLFEYCFQKSEVEDIPMTQEVSLVTTATAYCKSCTHC